MLTGGTFTFNRGLPVRLTNRRTGRIDPDPEIAQDKQYVKSGQRITSFTVFSPSLLYFRAHVNAYRHHLSFLFHRPRSVTLSAFTLEKL